MGVIEFTASYMFWHYGRAPADLLRMWKNFFWFGVNFFSLSTFARTLFSPWRRMSEGAGGGIEGFFSAMIVNTIMRMVGFFMKIFVIAAGVCFLALIVSVGAVALVVWIFAPALVVAALALGIVLIFS